MVSYTRFFLTAALVVVLAMILLEKTGDYLVIDQPDHADVIIVLAGDRNDRRFYRGLELLHQGYAPRMLVDEKFDEIVFGQTPAALEEQLIRSLNLNPVQVQVCPTQGDSTGDEARSVGRCLDNHEIGRVLLITSDFHTRRALSIFQHGLSKYRWSVAASRDDSAFNPKWWRRREWAKTALLEWTKLVWWEAVDRWRH